MASFTQEYRQAQEYIHTYTKAREQLAAMGILRSERNLQGDYAEWLAAHILNLTLAVSSVQKTYDATDSDGRTYQVKCRIVRDLQQGTSFDLSNASDRFDFLVLIVFSAAFELLDLKIVSFEVVRELGAQPLSTFRFRWNAKVAQDSRIQTVDWKDKIE